MRGWKEDDGGLVEGRDSRVRMGLGVIPNDCIQKLKIQKTIWSYALHT